MRASTWGDLVFAHGARSGALLARVAGAAERADRAAAALVVRVRLGHDVLDHVLGAAELGPEVRRAGAPLWVASGADVLGRGGEARVTVVRVALRAAVGVGADVVARVAEEVRRGEPAVRAGLGGGADEGRRDAGAGVGGGAGRAAAALIVLGPRQRAGGAQDIKAPRARRLPRLRTARQVKKLSAARRRAPESQLFSWNESDSNNKKNMFP